MFFKSVIFTGENISFFQDLSPNSGANNRGADSEKDSRDKITDRKDNI